jgi:hypothetical protein
MCSCCHNPFIPSLPQQYAASPIIGSAQEEFGNKSASIIFADPDPPASVLPDLHLLDLEGDVFCQATPERQKVYAPKYGIQREQAAAIQLS